MGKIVQLQNKKGEQQYPRTYAKAVIDDNGNSIDRVIENHFIEQDERFEDIMSDSIYSTDEKLDIAQAEETLITDALRKTPQILTREEKTQIRLNLDIPSKSDLIFHEVDSNSHKDIRSKIDEIDKNKQDCLISGYNISTINGQDITKGGNIMITPPDGKGSIGVGKSEGSGKGEIFNNYVSSILKNRAEGYNSHAEGGNPELFEKGEGFTSANGIASHAEGYSTEANGVGSHSEGGNTKSFGDNSHSEGENSVSFGKSSHAEGGSDSKPILYKNVLLSSTKISSDLNTEISEINDNSLNYFFTNLKFPWDLDKHIIKIDEESYFVNDVTSEGRIIVNKQIKFIYGLHNIISYSGNLALGDYSHSEGSNNISVGRASHSEGICTKTIGKASHASGEFTISSNRNQFTIGRFNTVDNNPVPEYINTEKPVFVVGNGTSEESRSDALIVNGNGSIYIQDIGNFNGKNINTSSSLQETIDSLETKEHSFNSYQPKGDYIDKIPDNYVTEEKLREKNYATVDKLNTKQDLLISGKNLSTIGGKSLLTEKNIEVGIGKSEGLSKGEIFNDYTNNSAIGINSHAEGENTNSEGRASHSEGIGNSSLGIASHSEGENTISSGKYSHTEGFGTIAENYSQHSQGQFNTKDGNPVIDSINLEKPVFVVGNGTSEKSRSDALRLLWNGELFISGVGGFKGNNPDSNTNSLQKVLDSLETKEHSSSTYQPKGNYATVDELNTKQDLLISGKNLSTIGGKSLLTEKNIEVGIGRSIQGKGEIFNDYTNNSAIGINSHAEGTETTAEGYNSHAEGNKTFAWHNSHAEGLNTVASGDVSHSQGNNTKAIGNNSMAAGFGTVADNFNQVSLGQFNTKNDNPSIDLFNSEKPVFVVGNGTSEKFRSDALRLLGDGKLFISGVGGFKGNNPDSNTNSLQKVLDSLETNSTNNKNNISELQNNLNSEIARSKTAEKVLTDNFNSEVGKITTEGIKITNALSQEVTRATNTENSIISNLTKEVTDRKAAITELKLEDVKDSTSYISSVSQNSGLITVGRTKLINSNDKILSTTSDGNIQSTLTIVKVQSTDTTIKESYELHGINGEILGEKINIYKDSSLESVELVNIDDKGTSGKFLKFVYIVATGDKEIVYVNVSELLSQNEFKDGLQINSLGEVSVKVDESSEDFLSVVSGGGIKVSGIQEAINTASSKATTEITQPGIDPHIIIGVTTSKDDSHKIYTITGNDIASATDLTTETETRVNQNNKIEESVGLNPDGTHKKTSGNYTSTATTIAGEINAIDTQLKTVTSKLSQEITDRESIITDLKLANVGAAEGKYIKIVSQTSGQLAAEADTFDTVLSDISTKAPQTKIVNNAITTITNNLELEVTRRNNTTGQSGQNYVANSGTGFINNATSLNDADIKMDAQIKINTDNITDLLEKMINVESRLTTIDSKLVGIDEKLTRILRF